MFIVVAILDRFFINLTKTRPKALILLLAKASRLIFIPLLETVFPYGNLILGVSHTKV